MRGCPDGGTIFIFAALNFACNTMGFPHVNLDFLLQVVKVLETILGHSVYEGVLISP